MQKNAPSEIFNDSDREGARGEGGNIVKCNDWEWLPFFSLFLLFRFFLFVYWVYYWFSFEIATGTTARPSLWSPRYAIYIEPSDVSIVDYQVWPVSRLQPTLVKLSLYLTKCGETWFANRLLMLNLLRQLSKLAAGTSAAHQSARQSIHSDFLRPVSIFLS